jgi:hypothetical protein
MPTVLGPGSLAICVRVSIGKFSTGKFPTPSIMSLVQILICQVMTCAVRLSKRPVLGPPLQDSTMRLPIW